MGILDWFLVTIQNLVTGFGLIKEGSGTIAIVMVGGLVVGYFVVRFAIWAALDYGPEGPSQTQLLIQGLFAGVSFFSPIDAIPDVIPGVGFADDIGMPLAFILGILFKILGSRTQQVPVRPRRRRRITDDDEFEEEED